MNDETENVSGLPVESAPQESQGETAPADDWAVTEETYEISETMANVATQETVLEDLPESTEETVSVVTAEVVQDAAIAVAHADLFGSFLVCGTLIGLALLRKVYGT